ncbi:MBL fold metallo-hydrolase [Micromonospora sp. NPDC049559]|uniref:MBL fold metallo-hydrolase n=1 Tax=Micromonospora sp. NPDC049559 TaxID=3155923 RepID=UPI003440AB64
MTTAAFTEVADRVHVLRHPVLDVNVTLIVGDAAALLVDTLSTAGQATELGAAVRGITSRPWAIVNTHHHFDHCFGNAALATDPAYPIYAHETTASLLRERPGDVRRLAHDEMLPRDRELAAELARTTILAPTHVVRLETTLDLGGRSVALRHFGRGHTEGDLVVHVPDADVLVAGDLLEQGAPPSFDDGYPVEWPETVAELLRLATPATAVVPGHGAVMDEAQARAQHEQLTSLAWLIREGHADGAPPERVAARAPFGPETALPAVRRGYAELTGRD